MAELSPKPTVAKIVIVKYRASVRVSVGVLKLAGSACAMRKQLAAKRSRNSGAVMASAPIARTPG